MTDLHRPSSTANTAPLRPDIVARERVRRVAVCGTADTSAEQVVAPTPAEEPYEVGRGKPPKHSQFKPGRSGNPQGRPKAARGLKTMVRELLTEKVKVRTAAGTVKMTRMQTMLHKIHERALNGDMRALQQLVTLYAASVPDEPVVTQAGSAVPTTPADMDAHDLAALDAFRAMMREEIIGEGYPDAGFKAEDERDDSARTGEER